MDELDYALANELAQFEDSMLAADAALEEQAFEMDEDQPGEPLEEFVQQAIQDFEAEEAALQEGAAAHSSQLDQQLRMIEESLLLAGGEDDDGPVEFEPPAEEWGEESGVTGDEPLSAPSTAVGRAASTTVSGKRGPALPPRRGGAAEQLIQRQVPPVLYGSGDGLVTRSNSVLSPSTGDTHFPYSPGNERQFRRRSTYVIPALAEESTAGGEVVYEDSLVAPSSSSSRSGSYLRSTQGPTMSAALRGKGLFLARRRLQSLEGVAVPDKLIQADLRSNQLADIEPLLNVGHGALQVLLLSCNDIGALSPSISMLRNLAELDLSYNRLTTLPTEIGQLGALRVLLLDHNQLKALPSTVGELRRLETLSVYHNALEGPLPASLGELHHLQTLNLSVNPKLGHLTAASLAGLRSLRRLNLWGSLLPSLTTDSQTESLQPPLHDQDQDQDKDKDKDKDKEKEKEKGEEEEDLSPVPPGISKENRIPNQTTQNHASMDPNGGSGAGGEKKSASIRGMRPVEETLHAVSKLVTLEDLDLRGNGLVNVPESLCGLTRLTRLGLSGNALTHLPRDINRLQALQVLDVARNGLYTVPPQIARLPSLTTLLLVGNPLESPRLEVVLKGTAAVVEYFMDILPGKYFDPYILDCLTRSVVTAGPAEAAASSSPVNVAGLRSILQSYPASVILRHKEQVLNALKARMKGTPLAQLLVDARMHVMLLACNSMQIVIHSIERLEVIAAEQSDVILQQDGIPVLCSIMNSTGDAALAKKIAIVLSNIVSQCSLETAAKVCQLGGHVFARYMVEVARRDKKYIASLMELAAQGSLEIHTRIRVRDVVFGKVIGKGASAVVYKGSYDGQEVAIKQFDIELIPEREFRREVALLTLLNIPSVLGCVGASLRHGFVVMRYYELGNLYTLLHTDEGARQLTEAISGKSFEEAPTLRRLTLRRKILMLKTIADAVAYIHSLGIIHRDLKSDNILVSKSLAVCIADLGISRVVSDRMTQAMGTPRYMAPEVLEGMPYDVGADVYSFGILAWEILTQSLPFAHMTTGWHVASAVIRGERPPLDDSIPVPIADIIRSCWSGVPSDRPTMKTVASQISKIISAVQLHDARSNPDS